MQFENIHQKDMKLSTSKLLIIQISDIHLKNQGNAAVDRIADIAKTVTNVEVDLQAAVIALSGDVAYSAIAKRRT